MMPHYRPEVCIASSEGNYSLILHDNQLRAHIDNVHGINSINIVIMILCWTSLIADSPVDPKKPKRVINKFCKELIFNPFNVIRTFTSLFDSITSNCYRDEKEGIIINTFQDGMKDTPIFREYLHFIRTRDPLTLKFILSFLSFGKKTYYESEELNSNAFREWSLVEERLEQLELPAFTVNLRHIMSWIFRDWSVDYFLPKHGGGSVSEEGIKGCNTKNINFTMDKKIYYLYQRENNIFLPNETSNNSIPSMTPATEIPSSRTYARLKFVPKDWKKTRSICMEPIVFQWAQQGVRLWYESYLSDSVLRHHVFLHDQTMNQKGAQFGSKTQFCDTLDLSSASDSVSWELVKNIFPAKVLKHLAATRTSMVELPNGDICSVKKYAPMGSALCFPVQSTIYSAITLMVGLAEYWGLDWRIPGIFNDVDMDKAYKLCFNHKHFKEDTMYMPSLVYGDDIICDKRITSSTIEALTSLGFKVNVSKSFLSNSVYRESCGKHYFDGNDVTPFTLKLKKVSGRIGIEALASIISSANYALEFNYLSLRKTLIQLALRYPIQGLRNTGGMNQVLFSNSKDDSFAILSSNPTNTHLKKRIFDKDLLGQCEGSNQLYQRDELRSITIRPRSKRKLSEKFDNYRYTMWWRSRYRVDETYDIVISSSAVDALGVGIGWRWTAI
jgi:hypothetical protein